MANQLKKAVVHAILTLKQLGWSQRRIAEELRIDRETVARCVHSPLADSKPATNPIPGSEVAVLACPGKSPSPESLCEPFRAVIEEKLTQGLTGQRIYQDLVEGHSFAASYSSLRRFLQHLDQSRPIPFRRLKVLPGEQAQVDFGAGAPILRSEGQRRRRRAGGDGRLARTRTVPVAARGHVTPAGKDDHPRHPPDLQETPGVTHDSA
jgi:hypothetical protein